TPLDVASVPKGLLSTGESTQAINEAVKLFPNVDACMLRVVVQKESGGNANAIGCDCAANGNAKACKDPRKYSPLPGSGEPPYDFNWNECSYGIGLTQ